MPFYIIISIMEITHLLQKYDQQEKKNQTYSP